MSETTMARLVKVLRANWQTKPEVRVRAILTALREPDEGMIAAGIAQLAECTDDWSVDAAPCIAEHVFPAMIDHILGEGQ